jgi:hypothetical protein
MKELAIRPDKTHYGSRNWRLRFPEKGPLPYFRWFEILQQECCADISRLKSYEPKAGFFTDTPLPYITLAGDLEIAKRPKSWILAVANHHLEIHGGLGKVKGLIVVPDWATVHVGRFTSVAIGGTPQQTSWHYSRLQF